MVIIIRTYFYFITKTYKRNRILFLILDFKQWVLIMIYSVVSSFKIILTPKFHLRSVPKLLFN